MRIAILAHLRQPVAEPFMGGMEAHCWHLAEGLSARGHEVVLFASGDSDPRFTIDAVLPEHHERTFPGREHKSDPALIAHVDAGYAAALERIARGGFDVLHNNSLSRLPLERRRTQAVPSVTSLHVPPYPALHGFVRASLAPTHRITVTSQAQLHLWWPEEAAPSSVSVLHNGIDPSAWPYRERGDGGAVWCGRIAAIKGTHRALAAARITGVPLTLFGPIEEPEYWRSEVEPLLGGPLRYGGHLDRRALADAVGRASVFLFTPCWDEPFGLVAVEAMACGVPVAALDMGAAREIVGEAGALAPAGDDAGLACAIERAFGVPRAIPRERAVRVFGRDLWLERCERLYARARAAEPRSYQLQGS